MSGQHPDVQRASQLPAAQVWLWPVRWCKRRKSLPKMLGTKYLGPCFFFFFCFSGELYFSRIMVCIFGELFFSFF